MKVKKATKNKEIKKMKNYTTQILKDRGVPRETIKTKAIELPLTHRDKKPVTTRIYTDDLKFKFTNDVLEFLKKNNIPYVGYAEDENCKYIHFNLWIDSSKEDFDFYWIQDRECDFESIGDLSIVNHGSCAAWYMNAPFIDCLEVVEHIFQKHAGRFKIQTGAFNLDKVED